MTNYLSHMRYIILIAFSLVFHTSTAQGDYLVTNLADTVFGNIGFVSGASFDEVTVKTYEGKKTFVSYKINLVRHKGDTYVPILIDNKGVMGKQIVKGSLSLYRIRGESQYDFATKILLKGNGKYVEVSNLGFKKYISDFLEECATVSNKILDGTYKSGDLEEIAEEYNSKCQNTVKPSLGSSLELMELYPILRDINTKKENGESIPLYLREALEKYRNQDLNIMINKFLNELENN